MLQDLLGRIALSIAAALLAGIGAGVTLVAISFAIYAALKPLVGAAGASGLTAPVTAALAGAGALLLLSLVKAPRKAPLHRAPLHRGAIAEIAGLLLNLVGDIATRRRAKTRQMQTPKRRRHR